MIKDKIYQLNYNFKLELEKSNKFIYKITRGFLKSYLNYAHPGSRVILKNNVFYLIDVTKIKDKENFKSEIERIVKKHFREFKMSLVELTKEELSQVL